MGLVGVLLIGIALAMDACAVAMTNGMTDVNMPKKRAFLIGLAFGFFQFLMPVIGYFITGIVAEAFIDVFETISAFVSFGVLAFLGGKMVLGCAVAWKKEKKKQETAGAGTSVTIQCACFQLTMEKLMLQAIATSIDALAVGVTLKMTAISTGLSLGMWGSTAVIGVVTFCLSSASVFIGKRIGDKLADKANFFGGMVLIGIGLKLLIEGLL
jgi:putative Mn2+ efflux pump MntP